VQGGLPEFRQPIPVLYYSGVCVPLSGSDIGTVFDNDCGGVLGHSTVFVPGHLGAGAGQAGDGQGGHDLDQSIADLLIGHVGGGAGGLDGLIQGVDGVIRIGTELIGDLAEPVLILRHEVLGHLVLRVGGEGSQQVDAFSQRGIEVLGGQDAVHAVHAEEGGGVAHGVGLGQNDRGGGIVDGQEQQIGAGGLGTSQLDVEVGLAGLGEGALIDDVHTAGIGLCLEVVPDTDGVLVIVFVDDGDLRTVEVLIDVLGGTGALVGVGEADLEHVIIVVDGNDIVAGGGGGQGEHPVLIGQRDHGKGRLGGDGAHQDLHAVVHQGVVGVDGGLSVVDVVLSHQLKLDVAAQGIDFVHRDLGGIGHAGAVDGGAAGQGANDADFEGAAAGALPAGRIAGVGVGFIRAAAGGQAEDHNHGHHEGKELLFHLAISFSWFRLYKKAAPPDAEPLYCIKQLCTSSRSRRMMILC
ncbi:Multidrug export protein mepA, partial [Dysosmobacter welbionis]